MPIILLVAKNAGIALALPVVLVFGAVFAEQLSGGRVGFRVLSGILLTCAALILLLFIVAAPYIA